MKRICEKKREMKTVARANKSAQYHGMVLAASGKDLYLRKAGSQSFSKDVT